MGGKPFLGGNPTCWVHGFLGSILVGIHLLTKNVFLALEKNVFSKHKCVRSLIPERLKPTAIIRVLENSC